MKRNEHARQVEVGVFLAVGLAVLLAMLIAVGHSQRPFQRRVSLRTSFHNTAGLLVGAPVRLAGVEVGVVQQIHFATDPDDADVKVAMSVSAPYLDRIRADSIATLAPKGLLGDMTVDITVGNRRAAPLRDGAEISSQETRGVAEVVSSVNQGIDEVRALSRDVRRHVDTLLTPGLARDVGRIASAAADAAEAVERGDGLAHALIYEKELAGDARTLARGAARSSVDLAQAVARVERIAAAVEEGDGSLHTLIYGDDATAILANARQAAQDLADAARAMQRGPGPLHELIHGREASELIANLTALSRTLRGLGDDVARGKGTIGALLEDPAVYEDLKIMLREIHRNTLLKALVRYTIEHDHLSR